MKFKHIISIGYFCSVASELDRKSFRSEAYPFDWLIIDLDSLTDLISNKFKDFINPTMLAQYIKPKNVIMHTKYNLKFFHDFDPQKSIINQLPKAGEKFFRRIKRLYDALNSQDPILFVRYISTESTNKDTPKKITRFISEIEKFTNNFQLLLINHSDQTFSHLSPKILDELYVKKDQNDQVARKFFDNQKISFRFQNNVEIDIKKRIYNLNRFREKQTNTNNPNQ
ncbi:DUF1796 family putative cysteine peptidase [Patescibacteria group bacterium]